MSGHDFDEYFKDIKNQIILLLMRRYPMAKTLIFISLI